MTTMVNKLCDTPGSPCLECLITMTCTKSINKQTACEPYTQFIIKLVEKEYARTDRLCNK